MKKFILLASAIAITTCAISQEQANLSVFKYLIKDSVVLSNVNKGVYDHPALEVAANTAFNKIVRKNYPIRIAIDPGHFATNKKESLLEERYINSEHGFFHESFLTISTGLILKEKLEQRGFQVMLTRTAETSALGKSFTKWLKEDLHKSLKADLESGVITKDFYTEIINAEPKVVFQKYFKDKELQARVDKINMFNPDITLVIHYNASEFENSPERFVSAVEHNYSVCFVPGSFTRQELALEDQMSDFIRLASTDNITRSIELSSFIEREFASKLKAPALLPDQYKDLWFLKKYSVYTGEPGVFARNLPLTRKIQSPVCYGECFLQNNANEITQLSDKSVTIDGQKVPARVKEVADCWYTGVIKYFTQIGYITN